MPRSKKALDSDTTPAVEKSQIRKKRIKKEKWKWWQEMSQKLGISILEAKAQAARECSKINSFRALAETMAGWGDSRYSYY